MGSKRPQTWAKRERELAVKERRDLKRAKKDAAAAARIGTTTDAAPLARAQDDVSDAVRAVDPA